MLFKKTYIRNLKILKKSYKTARSKSYFCSFFIEVCIINISLVVLVSGVQVIQQSYMSLSAHHVPIAHQVHNGHALHFIKIFLLGIEFQHAGACFAFQCASYLLAHVNFDKKLTIILLLVTYFSPD